jgi:hypothetical protein
LGELNAILPSSFILKGSQVPGLKTVKRFFLKNVSKGVEKRFAEL